MGEYKNQKLISISKSLASTSGDFGPNLELENENIILDHNNSESDFGNKKIKILYNNHISNLYREELKNLSSNLTSQGAISVLSGAKTGRCPQDKRIVEDEKTVDIWWDKNSPNIPIDNNNYLITRETAICFLNNQDKLYIFDGYAGWCKTHQIKVRVICTRAYHSLFMSNMLIKPTPEELKDYGEPDYTIYNAGEFPCNIYNDYMTSSTSVLFNFTRKEILILGTQYAGEMKKGIFSVMHYLMPLKGVLSLHSSANQDQKGNVTLFFGLSGTGKTTLSADPDRILIGDDEHCWGDDGIFNIEGGCYAKCINLNPKKEPLIYNSIKFGSLVENVILDQNYEIDFDDSTITQNTRVSYPLEFIENNKIPAIGNHPNNIIFLTCDAFGILPPISRLSIEQALYYFISGYTAKIPGTEQGIKLPEATFSACFGEAFIIWNPLIYALDLKNKLIKHGTKVWLVNTGWRGGSYGHGERYDINYTRKIIYSINNNSIDEKYENLDIFNLKYPVKIDNLDSNLLNPRNSWKDKKKYDAIRFKLANMFDQNFKKYKVHKLYHDLNLAGPIIN
jgi:phosphoenolpyruvate carboxykinase (ATP)